MFCSNQVKRCDPSAPRSLGSLSWGCEYNQGEGGRDSYPASPPIPRYSGWNWNGFLWEGLGVGSGQGPQGEAGLHLILPTVLGCHSPHAEATTTPVCFQRSHPVNSKIPLQSTRSGASMEGLLTGRE